MDATAISVCVVDRVATPGLAKAASSLAKHKQASLRQSTALGPPWGQTGVLSNRNLCGSASDLKPLLNPVAPHNVAFKLMMPRMRRGGQNPTQPCELKILKGGFSGPRLTAV